MHRLLTVGGAILVVLFASAYIDARRTASRVQAPLRLKGFAASAGAPVRARVLLQLSDCTGNLRVLDLLHRSDLPDRLRLDLIWYVGDHADTTAIRAALPVWARSVPMRQATTDLLRAFARLGHTSTPALALFDLDGRMRLLTQAPTSAREFAGLRRAIEGLTWFEGL